MQHRNNITIGTLFPHLADALFRARSICGGAGTRTPVKTLGQCNARLSGKIVHAQYPADPRRRDVVVASTHG
eukprot:9169091-Pyramimonas_sp.AAC.1